MKPQTKKRHVKQFGWVPDLPDQRDLMYSAPSRLLRKLPSSKDLRNSCPPVYDQGALGSCTANAIGAAYEFELRRKANKMRAFTPSRLFIYYNERVIEGTVNTDAGAMIRDGMKTVNKDGVCPERMWPYDIRKFVKLPPDPCYIEAQKHQVLSYHRVRRDLKQMKSCLADGFPFVFGFTVYESFESDEVAETGKLNMPAPAERELGGHAVLAVGYSDASKRFWVRNSWGKGWGKAGYYSMPYDYLLNENLSDDFWTIRIVEG